MLGCVVSCVTERKAITLIAREGDLGLGSWSNSINGSSSCSSDTIFSSN